MYQKQSISNFEKYCEILNTSNNVEVIQIVYGKTLDLESFLNGIYDIPSTKIVNINHVFKVKK